MANQPFLKKILLWAIFFSAIIHCDSAAANQFYQASPGQSTTVNEWSECRRVNNALGWPRTMIPTNTANEWAQFRIHYPSHISLAACGWAYRMPITVSNQTGAIQNDYQVLATINTANLIATGKMRSDCGDIRMRDTNGTTDLSYWIQSGCNTAATKIWTKVSSINAGSKTIYAYYGYSPATSLSNLDATFISDANNYEKDPVGTSFSQISYWDWREGRSTWADGNWQNTNWSIPAKGRDLKIDGSRYFNGTKSIYSYLLSNDYVNHDAGRYCVQEFYTEPTYRILALNDYIRVRLTDIKRGRPNNYNWPETRWAWRIAAILASNGNSTYSLLRCGSWGKNEGCTPQDNFESQATGSDGRVWSVYRINIPAGYDKNALSLNMRHWQDSWDFEDGYSSFYLDFFDDFRMRKYATPDLTTTAGNEESI